MDYCFERKLFKVNKLIQVKNMQQCKTPEMKEYRKQWFNVPHMNTENGLVVSA